METYYNTLEIKEGSDIETIKKAYHRLAIKCHPDKTNDPNAHENFKRINKAYEFLSDETKKANYDKTLNFSETLHYVPQGTDLKVILKVKIAELVKCQNRVIVTKRKGQCPSCEGTGSATKKIKKCNFCNGSGLQGMPLLLGHKKRCNYCEGVGYLPIGDKCYKCNGSTLITEIIRHEIKLNPFSEVIIIDKMGNYPVGNYPIGKGKPGDLIVELEIEQEPFYKVRGLDISCNFNISPAQAILGDVIPLRAFDKKIKLKIPPGITDNSIIEQKGGGITYKGQTGLFRAVINIVIPNILSEEEKILYQKILDIERTTLWQTPQPLKW